MRSRTLFAKLFGRVLVRLGIRPKCVPFIVQAHVRACEETRSPGVYWEETSPGYWVPEIVFEPGTEASEDEQIDRYLAEIGAALRPPRNWREHLLLIKLDPRPVLPPLDLPTE